MTGSTVDEIDVGGLRIAYERAGTGPPLGGGLAIERARRVAAALAPRCLSTFEIRRSVVVFSMSKTTVISSNGQIVIPASLRRQLGLEPGDVLQVSAEGESLRVERVPDWEELFGSVGRRGRKPPSTDEIEAIRRARAGKRHERS